MPLRVLIEEQLDDRDADDLEFERTGHYVFVLPSSSYPIDCDSEFMYE